MNVAHKTEKMKNLAFPSGEENKIYVTHITIHESVFFLLLKLLVIEIAGAIGVVLLHGILFTTNVQANYFDMFTLYMIPFYLLLVVVKTALTIFVIIQWFEETYEITTNEVVHRKGVFLRDTERFTLKHIGTVKVQQTFWGRLFNYGTLTLYDWVNGKNIYLYLIHDPLRYNRILQEITPEADQEKLVFREHLAEGENRQVIHE